MCSWRAGFKEAQETKKRLHFNDPAPLKTEEWLRVQQNNTQNLGALRCLAMGRKEGLPIPNLPEWAEEDLKFWGNPWKHWSRELEKPPTDPAQAASPS